MMSWARCVLGQTQDVVELPAEALETPTRIPQRPSDRLAEPRRALSLGQGIAIGLLFAIAAIAGWIGYEQAARAQGLERQLGLAHQQVNRLQEDNRQLARQLASVQDDQHAFDERLTSLNAQLTAAASELDQAKTQLTAAQDLMNQLHERRTTLELELTQVRSQRDALEQDRDRFKEDNAELARSVGRLRQQLALLDRDYQRLTAQVSAVNATPHPDVRVAATTGPLPTHPAASAAHAAPSLREDTVELPPVIVNSNP